MPRRLAELTYAEAASATDGLVLVPIGSTEAHGPHLPLATDVLLSEELAHRAALDLEQRGFKVLIAPSLAYAVTEFASPFAGTVSISAATATALYVDVCLGLRRQGFARVCLINTHLEPAHVETLRAACARVATSTSDGYSDGGGGCGGGGAIAFPDQTEKRWARTLGDEYRRGECHAGCYETSLLLAARSTLVRDHVRAALPHVPINLAHAMRDGKRNFIEAGASEAYFGDPAAATVQEGDRLYALLVEMVRTVVAETFG